jgi:hypothetical protein
VVAFLILSLLFARTPITHTQSPPKKEGRGQEEGPPRDGRGGGGECLVCVCVARCAARAITCSPQTVATAAGAIAAASASSSTTTTSSSASRPSCFSGGASVSPLTNRFSISSASSGLLVGTM